MVAIAGIKKVFFISWTRTCDLVNFNPTWWPKGRLITFPLVDAIIDFVFFVIAAAWSIVANLFVVRGSLVVCRIVLLNDIFLLNALEKLLGGLDLCIYVDVVVVVWFFGFTCWWSLFFGWLLCTIFYLGEGDCFLLGEFFYVITYLVFRLFLSWLGSIIRFFRIAFIFRRLLVCVRTQRLNFAHVLTVLLYHFIGVIVTQDCEVILSSFADPGTHLYGIFFRVVSYDSFDTLLFNNWWKHWYGQLLIKIL